MLFCPLANPLSSSVLLHESSNFLTSCKIPLCSCVLLQKHVHFYPLARILKALLSSCKNPLYISVHLQEILFFSLLARNIGTCLINKVDSLHVLVIKGTIDKWVQQTTFNSVNWDRFQVKWFYLPIIFQVFGFLAVLPLCFNLSYL